MLHSFTHYHLAIIKVEWAKRCYIKLIQYQCEINSAVVFIVVRETLLKNVSVVTNRAGQNTDKYDKYCTILFAFQTRS